jgi:hypothetical protein
MERDHYYIPKSKKKKILLILTHQQNYRWYFVGDVLYLLMDITTDK